MSEAATDVAVAAGLRTLADELDGRRFREAGRKGISEAARRVIEAVGECPDCPYCHGDAWVPEGEDKAKPCQDCRQTGLDLPEIVELRLVEREDRIRELEERVADLVEQRECAGQTSLEEAG